MPILIELTWGFLQDLATTLQAMATFRLETRGLDQRTTCSLQGARTGRNELKKYLECQGLPQSSAK